MSERAEKKTDLRHLKDVLGLCRAIDIFMKKRKTGMKNSTRFVTAGVFFLLFLALLFGVKFVDVKTIGPADTQIGFASLNGAVHDFFSINMTLKTVTDCLGYGALSLVAVFAVLGVVRLVSEKSFKKVEPQLYCLAGLYVALGAVYVFFEKVIINYRPVLLKGDVTPEASFPSSHTMLGITIFGSTAIMLGWYIKKDSLRKTLQLVLVLLSAGTAIGRLMSGVHWFTDIAAGVCISLSLVFMFSGVAHGFDKAVNR